MGFQPGDRVWLRGNAERIGVVIDKSIIYGGIQYYKVFWPPSTGTQENSEIDLLPCIEGDDAMSQLLSKNVTGYEDFLSLLTYQTLNKQRPLSKHLYAFNASRTLFYPYQFKPLIKFIQSENHRILVCDEVGLGKTIEAGLILKEYRARNPVQRVLVVCPSSLKEKWKMELRKRFDENFRILTSKEIKQFIKDIAQMPDQEAFNGIVSYETIRQQEIIDLIKENPVSLDLIIFDEAHHMRNTRTLQHEVASFLCNYAAGVVMLTATPVHLGNENLFSLVHLLSPEEFPDKETALERFRQNEPIVRAQNCLSHNPPEVGEAIKSLRETKDSRWFENNPYYQETWDRFNELHQKINENNQSIKYYYRELLEAQKSLSSLNLIGHIFTRKRKREVQEFITRREPNAIEVVFNEEEEKIYQGVCDYIRNQAAKYQQMKPIDKWWLTMIQRRMASSLPAMIDYYCRGEDSLPEDVDSWDIISPEIEQGHSPVRDSRKKEIAGLMRTMLRGRRQISRDSKFEEMWEAITQLRKRGGQLKIVLFAFFRETLNYLQHRLSEKQMKVTLIHGGIPIDDRLILIDKFQNDDLREILLSSRVGGEGLDFQFANILINYDLPWNPMEVEQRIGRLDRIGQKSAVIHIYHFWIKGTVEERILRRLYERVGVFSHTIGELEPILGDVIQGLENKVFEKVRSPEEEEQEIEWRWKILEDKNKEILMIDEKVAEFIGTDIYFTEEIDRIRKSRQFSTPEQIRNFFEFSLKRNFPYTRWEWHRLKKTGKLYACDEFNHQYIDFQIIHGLPLRYIDAGKGKEITFCSETAFHNPHIEFVNIGHPMTGMMVKLFDKRLHTKKSFHGAYHVRLSTDMIPPGMYIFFLYRVTINSAHTSHDLKFILFDEHLHSVLDETQEEELFGELLEKGENPVLPLPDYMEQTHSLLKESQDKANTILKKRLEEIRTNKMRFNDLFINRRKTSIELFHNKQIKRAEQNIAEHPDKEGYVKIQKGVIRNKKAKLKRDLAELETKRVITVEDALLCVGILEIYKAKHKGGKKDGNI